MIFVIFSSILIDRTSNYKTYFKTNLFHTLSYSNIYILEMTKLTKHFSAYFEFKFSDAFIAIKNFFSKLNSKHPNGLSNIFSCTPFCMVHNQITLTLYNTKRVCLTPSACDKFCQLVAHPE